MRAMEFNSRKNLGEALSIVRGISPVLAPHGLALAFLALCICAFGGCDSTPYPEITSVYPDGGACPNELWDNKQDGDAVELHGHNFIPETRIDPVSGKRSTVTDGFFVRLGKGREDWQQLTGAVWRTPNLVTAYLKTSAARLLPVGESLDVELTDPRGHTTRGVGLFRMRSSCTPATIVVDLSSIQPNRGGTGGGTEIVIRGKGFAAGMKFSLDNILIIPSGGIVIDSNTVTGRTPPHEAIGLFNLALEENGEQKKLLAGAFAYAAPPVIWSVSPISTDRCETTGLRDSAAADAPEGRDEADAGVAIDTGIDNDGKRAEIDAPSDDASASTADAEDDSTALVRVRVLGDFFTPNTRIYFGDDFDKAVPLRDVLHCTNMQIIGLAPRKPSSVYAVDPELGFTMSDWNLSRWVGL
jgi:hypothetical protein